jgi:predicted enzyme involved in methoxymalonyl-ACP biosynthesis
MTAYKELKRKALAAETADMDTVRAALLCDTASQFLAAALKGVAAERGFRLDLFEADYNQVESQFFNPASEFHAFNPEYAIVFQSTHKLPPPPPTNTHSIKTLRTAVLTL